LLLFASFALTVSVLEFISGSGPLIFTPGAYAIGLKPPTEVIVDRYIPVEAVFFRNGDAALTLQSKLAATMLGKRNDCPNARIDLLPWVSSAEFADDPKGEKNLALARNRADAVKKLILHYAPRSQVRSEDWASFDTLRAKLMFDDRRSTAHEEAPDEALNRRVDIRVEKGCEPTAPPQQPEQAVAAR